MRDTKKRILDAAIPSLLLAITFCVYGPLELFMSNLDEFWFGIADVIPVIATAFIVVFLGAFALTYALSGKFRYISAIAFGLGISLYLQGNYMFFNYGTLDGTPIDWSSFGIWPIVNTVIWVGLIVLPCLLQWKKEKLYSKISGYLSIGILCIQLITLVTLAVNIVSENKTEGEYTLTNNGQFTLSEEENTIIFVLDCFDQAVFSAYTEEYPEIVENLFSDFTAYPDTVGGSARTVVAMPHIITGQPYTRGGGYQEYINREANDAELYDALIRNNYDIAFYTDSTYVPWNADFEIMNLEQGGAKVGSYGKLAYYTYKLTAFRYFPHVLKAPMWMYTGDFAEAADLSGSDESGYVINDALFYQMLTEKKISLQNEHNSFRLYHLMGAHTPYTLDANSQRVSESSQFEQISGVFNILAEYFAQMDALGIYENANIIVMADHGEYTVGQNPLFLVKTSKAAGEVRDFTVSQLPVSYSNLHPTLMEMIGVETEDASIFDLTMDDNLYRYFYANPENTLKEYVISGYAGDSENTKATGNEFVLFKDTDGNSSDYILGTEILFTPNGKGINYSKQGFGVVYTDFTWIEEKHAVLEIPLEQIPERDLFVTMDLRGVYGGLQHAKVSINGQSLNEYLVQMPEFCFKIPRSYINEKKLTIELEMPEAAELSGASGLMSIAVHSICVSGESKGFEEARYVSKLSYGELNPDNIAIYSRSGFALSEGSHIWTNGKEAILSVELDQVPENDVSVTMDLMIYAPQGSQSVTIYANDMLCYVNELSKAGQYTFAVPKETFANSAKLNLRFELPDAISPEEAGLGSDSRLLALGFYSLNIQPNSSKEPAIALYEAGQEIVFGAEGNASAYIFAGIGLNEVGHSWTLGKESYLRFDIGGIPTSDLTVTLDVGAVYGANGPQTVKISANGIVCYEDVLECAKEIEFTVPQSAMNTPYLILCLEHPNAVSPFEVNGTGDSRTLALDLYGMSIRYDGVVPYVPAPAEPQGNVDVPKETQAPDATEEETGFGITDIVAIPLTALMNWCYSLLGNYGLTIIVFTVLSKIILLPVSMWVHKNGITMVKITPEVNRVKIKHFGDKDTIDDETQALYKREKYNPLASTVPMIVQIVMLLGVIGAVKNLLSGADSVLTLVPSQAGGLTYLMPLAAGAAALVLGLAQNHLSPLQREQGKKEQWMSNGFSIAISLFLGAFVSLGVGIYWIASNLLSIVQQMLLNVMIKPGKYIDYEALEESKKELASLNSLSAEVSKEDKKREQADYKRFFSVANKHLVFYSEKSGFYKYYKDVMDFMLKYSNVIIHYVTNDPKDQIFKIAESQPRIKPYYISEKKLITLLMKMDADIVVMTCPDLDRYHLKRSYVRKDIEYVYMFHYPLSTHMVLNTGALDHYDTILCVGDFQFEEIRAAERLYNLPEKKLISAGYGQLEQLHNSYQKMEKVKRDKPKILVAPSWQLDNILDSCIDPLLNQLLGKGYEVVVRPHPEYVKRYKPRMDAIVQRYSGREDLTFELDFTSNDSLFNSDIIISDWSGSAYEFSLVTLKPAVFINTPPKINNPEYDKLNVEPLEFKLRGEVGIQIDPNNMEGLDKKINDLLENSEAYADQIKQIREKYIANFGRSGEIGGKYILSQLLERQKKK